MGSTMKYQELTAVIMAKTGFSVTKAEQKALRILCGHFTLEDVIGETKIDTAKHQKIWVPSGHLYSLGVECKTLTRTVIGIEESGFGSVYGKVKIYKKEVKVYQTAENEWSVA